MNLAIKSYATLAVAASATVLLGGCADGGRPSASVATSTLASGGATQVYVLQEPASSTASFVYQYSLQPASNAAPSLIITPPSGFYATAVATDSNGQLYVGGELTSSGQGEVLVYGVNSGGIPTNTILGGLYYSSNSATFAIPATMIVSNGVLYIGSTDQAQAYVTALPTGATGTPTPTLQLTGSSTQLYDPLGIAVDGAGDIYVSQDTAAGAGQVLYFGAGSTGNTAPARTITNALVPYGIALDAGGNLYAALDSYNFNSAGAIVEFAAGASGAATPVKTLSGSNTGLFIVGGVRLDTAGNLYAVAINSSGANSVLGFGSASTGNTAPALTLSSAVWNSPGSELAVH